MVINTDEILQILKSNKEWIFSGIGVFVLSGILWVIKRHISVKQYNARNTERTPIPNFLRENGNINFHGNVTFNGDITFLQVFVGDARDLHQDKERINPSNFDKLMEAVEKELKLGEKIEAKVSGKMTLQSSSNYETGDGLLVATNRRMVIAIISMTMGPRIDRFTYKQVKSVLLIEGEVRVVLPNEVLTLHYVVSDSEQFSKYIVDKKTPPPKNRV